MGGPEVVRWWPVLTIAKLSRWSINYYNDTARAAGAGRQGRAAGQRRAGRVLLRARHPPPVWLCAGDARTAAELVGLSDVQRAGGQADPEVVARWLDDGVAPNGECGRAFGARAVHGFDLTFCAPKSVSLIRALRGDDVIQKAVADAHATALAEAMEYLAAHAGYTRVHNPVTGEKDLVRLPGLVAIGYQHETSRAGDPHLHTHVIVPNRQPRADGKLVSIDGTSLYHEARAAGVIYQATLRRELHRSIGVEWAPVDASTGMAELAGIDAATISAWSQRCHPAARVGGQQSRRRRWRGAHRRRSWRPRRRPPARPNPNSWPGRQLRQMWAQDTRGTAAGSRRVTGRPAGPARRVAGAV